MPRIHPTKRVLPAVASAVVASTLYTGDASAAPPFVDRRQLVPSGVFAFDGALGVARYDYGPGVSGTGAGANVELGAGFRDRFELGFALGMRFGTDGQRGSADDYAKLVDYRTFGRDGDRAFSPEIRFKSQVLDVQIFELSLELRGGLSVSEPPPLGVGDNTTRPAMRAGVPIAFHFANLVRLDSGFFLRLVFADPTRTGILLPLDAWFQITPRIWAGPHAGILFSNPGGQSDLQLGLGGGYQVADSVDLKASLFFPHVDDRSADFGFGVGVQLRTD